MISLRTVVRVGAAARAVLVAVLVTASPAAPAAEAGERPGTAADCHNLLHQFDVAWPAHKDMVRADAARRSRDLGASDCQAGRYTEGVHLLRRALHDIGVKPVKGLSVAPRP